MLLKTPPNRHPSQEEVEEKVKRLFRRNPITVDTAKGIAMSLGYSGQVTDALHRLSREGIIVARPIGNGTDTIFGPLLQRE